MLDEVAADRREATCCGSFSDPRPSGGVFIAQQASEARVFYAHDGRKYWGSTTSNLPGTASDSLPPPPPSNWKHLVILLDPAHHVQQLVRRDPTRSSQRDSERWALTKDTVGITVNTCDAGEIAPVASAATERLSGCGPVLPSRLAQSEVVADEVAM